MTQSQRFWPILIMLSAACAILVTLIETAPPLRAALTLWFMLVCPGMAYVRLLGLSEPFVTWTLAIALSIATSTLVGMGMLVVDLWSPQAGLVILATISVAGAVLQIAWHSQVIPQRMGFDPGKTAPLGKGRVQ